MIAGLALLAKEFAWAGRELSPLKTQVHRVRALVER
jgi:hypothetical protein